MALYCYLHTSFVYGSVVQLFVIGGPIYTFIKTPGVARKKITLLPIYILFYIMHKLLISMTDSRKLPPYNNKMENLKYKFVIRSYKFYTILLRFCYDIIVI